MRKNISIKTDQHKYRALPQGFPSDLIFQFREFFDDYFPSWKEIILIKTVSGPRCILFSGDKLTEIGIGAIAFQLINAVEVEILNWSRIAITHPNANFKQIKYAEAKPGMLLRGTIANTTLYIYVKIIDYKTQIVYTDQEGADYDYSIPGNMKYKFTLLNPNFPKTEYDKIIWPSRT